MEPDLAAPRIEPWFWDLIEASKHDLESLRGRLELLPKEQLYHFQYQFREAMDCVMPCRALQQRIPAGFRCSEDTAEDFAEWVVSQGRRFYSEVRSHPERVQDFLDMFRACSRGLGYQELRWLGGHGFPFAVGFEVFESRFGADITAAIESQEWEIP
jgi:hypothetical protein